MKETAWDKHWKKQQGIEVENIIKNDPYFRLLKRLIGLQQNDGLRILEVGCGSGTRTLALLKDFEGKHFKAVFVDLSIPALSFTKRTSYKYKITADFILANGLRLPFPDEKFDIVWNEGVNEHFKDEERQKIFDEMARVCKKEGEVIVIVPNALNLPYRITKKVLEMRNTWEYGFEKPYTVFELKRRMSAAGITTNKTSGTQIIASFLTFIQLVHSEALKLEIHKLNKILKGFDEYMEKAFGAFFSKDIGVKGVKNDNPK